MKRKILIGALFISMFSYNVKAQIEEVGQNYIKMQFVQPLGEYKDYYNSGFGFEYGRIFPFNFDIADGFVIPGIDITFISTQFNTGKEKFYFNAKNKLNDTYEFKSQGGLLWNIGVKLGPMVTVGITDGLVADFAIQYDPTIIFNLARKGVSEDIWNGGAGRVEKKSASSLSFAHRIGIKGDIRYSHFLFGLEFVLGGTTFSYTSNVIPEIIGGDIRFYKDKEVGLGTLLLNFGFTF